MEAERRSKRARGAMPKDLEGEEKRGRLDQAEGQSLQAVLNNQLVCEKIASFLSLSDMKAASEVNRQFLQAMRGTQRFVQEAVLAITDKNAAQSTLQKMEYPWRGVRIDVTDSADILDDLPRVLKSAQFVSLGAPPEKIKIVTRAVDPRDARLLTIVLNSTPALSHLRIGNDVLFTNLRIVLSSPAVQGTLRNLTRLDIVATVIEEEADERMEPFAMNLRLLMEHPNRLKSLNLSELYPETADPDGNYKFSVNLSVLNLLKTNRATLEDLSLHEKVWELQELRTLTFPVLKTLSAIVLQKEEKDTLAKFLNNQKSLEELTVDSSDMDECLFTSIRGRCMELRKLDLTSQDYTGDVEEWSFLGSMNRLTEFRFNIKVIAEAGEDGVRNGWRLLAFLPKNQLERLSLQGISTDDYGFWGVEGGVEEAEFEVKTELLEGFRCLRRLSLLGSRDAVDDQLMQWLLKEFLSLEELEISDCSDLSNAGMSGDTRAEWGRCASLSDLRGLKTLKILNCPEVTLKGVASCVRLPFLNSLVYSPPWTRTVRDSVVMELAGQNPRLERLTLHYRGDVDDLEKLKANVIKKNPRVELSFAEEEEEEEEWEGVEEEEEWEGVEEEEEWEGAEEGEGEYDDPF